MKIEEVAAAFVGWIGDELDIPETARYPYPVMVKLGPMTSMQPDVAAHVLQKRIVRGASVRDEFPLLGVEQIELVRVFDVTASIMLATQIDPDDDSPGGDDVAAEVHARLSGYADKLEASAANDVTLGNRMGAEGMISPAMSFDLSTVFDEDEAGTRGRLLVATFTVAEPATGAIQ